MIVGPIHILQRKLSEPRIPASPCKRTESGVPKNLEGVLFASVPN